MGRGTRQITDAAQAVDERRTSVRGLRRGLGSAPKPAAARWLARSAPMQAVSGTLTGQRYLTLRDERTVVFGGGLGADLAFAAAVLRSLDVQLTLGLEEEMRFAAVRQLPLITAQPGWVTVRENLAAGKVTLTFVADGDPDGGQSTTVDCDELLQAVVQISQARGDVASR